MVKYQKTIEQVAGVALIGAIIIGCGFVLRPFISAILWAAILCSATWPLHEMFLRWLRGWRNLAAGLMTLLISVVLIIPFVVVGFTFTDSVRSVLDRLGSQEATQAVAVIPVEPAPIDLLDPAGEVEIMPADPNEGEGTQKPVVAEEEQADPNGAHILPPPPDWVERIPLVGERIRDYWLEAEANAEPTIQKLRPYLNRAGLWLLGRSLDLVQGVLQLVLSVVIAFFLYRDGAGLVSRLDEGFQRISGDHARHLIDVVKVTVRSVVYGVIGTGLAQGIVAGIGFSIAQVPSPMLLGLFTFFLSFVPMGPPIIWIGASIWLFGQDRTSWGIFMAVYGLFAISSVDNVVKPIIISRGSKLPFVVMFIGVLGGIATFGFIGIFIGPTLLAVGFSLFQEILDQRRIAAASKPAAEPTESADAPPVEDAAAGQPPSSAEHVPPASGQEVSAD